MQPISEDPELLQAFLVESEELLQGLDHDLVKLESTPADQELLNQAFRALHTIKGTTGGPKALQEILPELPGDLPVDILVVQHMPPGSPKHSPSG